MRKLKDAFLLLVAFASAALFANGENQQLIEEARSLKKSFVSTLKPELLGAIENGGLVSAISVCSEKAPQIAARLTEDSGWQVSRVSAKPRNANTAKSDARGLVEADALEVYELTERSFRYLKGQTVAGAYINCHGEYITPQVKAAIDRTYPQDLATGYRLGT
jgi:hypothetical protein